MNKFFKVATAIAITAPMGVAFASDNSDVAAKLAQLEAIVQKQQTEIAALKGQTAPNRELVADLVQEELDARLDGRIEEGLAALKADGSVLGLGKGIDGLKLAGDARFRYELNERNKGPLGVAADTDDEWDRYRLRLRIGAVWTNKAENWELAMGLEVGSGDGNSANATLSPGASAFSSLPVFLDYAYAKHKIDAFSLTIGQMKSPFETTNMTWDDDLRPVGIVGQFADAGFFATAGVFDLLNAGAAGAADAEALMAGGQVGFAQKGESSSYTVALGYQHFSPASLHKFVAATDNSPNEAQIIDLLGKFGTDIGTMVKKDGVKPYLKLELWANIGMNLGADGTSAQSQIGALPAGETPDDQDMYYGLGAKGTIDVFSFGYAWKHIESDSIFRLIGDSDFGSTSSGQSNVEGHELKLGYAINKNVSLGLTALLYEDIEDNGGYDKGETYQLDLVYKF